MVRGRCAPRLLGRRALDGARRSAASGPRHRSEDLTEDFYGANKAVNYTCSSAIFSWAEDVHGADAPRALAEAAYTAGTPDPAKAALGVSEDRMLAQVAAWL